MHAKRGIKKKYKEGKGELFQRIKESYASRFGSVLQIWQNKISPKTIWPVGSGKTCFYGLLSVKIIIKLLITLATLTHVWSIN